MRWTLESCVDTWESTTRLRVLEQVAIDKQKRIHTERKLKTFWKSFHFQWDASLSSRPRLRHAHEHKNFISVDLFQTQKILFIFSFPLNTFFAACIFHAQLPTFHKRSQLFIYSHLYGDGAKPVVVIIIAQYVSSHCNEKCIELETRRVDVIKDDIIRRAKLIFVKLQIHSSDLAQKLLFFCSFGVAMAMLQSKGFRFPFIQSLLCWLGFVRWRRKQDLPYNFFVLLS